MATVQLNNNQEYTFARWNPYGGSIFTIFTDGTDRAQKAKTFNNRVNINKSNSGVATLLDIDQESTSGTAAMVALTNATTSGNAGIRFSGQNTWYVGTANDTSNEDDFQITDLGQAVTTGARTSIFVGLTISKTREIFLPNIDAAAGTFPVEYNTTTREITYDSSTLRTKKNITTAPSLLFDKVLELQPKEFERKNSKSNNITSTGKFIGLIAEEAAAVHSQFAKYAPNFDYDENGKRSENVINNDLVPGNIDWPAVTTALIGKVQQLEDRIKTLEGNV